ncbi:uncharacterized protein LOC110006606 isoform X2 [Amborella trichopoda]|uniref:uncharacterized protein LOC110006606 isoform X2 n=1 Tax=Amborella trichopoda TaxID=13333 RepID=UPI0009C03CD2|nr:uncharacterized protein LOC110006606 isoform X2 [Amborella trichopoda]|eukprot:XP_020518340.1 uncharacterized protein LOC110006606 isoform X2 [Amborella trichopoda]
MPQKMTTPFSLRQCFKMQDVTRCIGGANAAMRLNAVQMQVHCRDALILMIKNDSSCHRSNSLLQKSFKGNISNRAPQENFRRMLGVKTHLSVGFPLTSRVPRSGHIMKYAFDNFDDLFAHSFYLPI